MDELEINFQEKALQAHDHEQELARIQKRMLEIAHAIKEIRSIGHNGRRKSLAELFVVKYYPDVLKFNMEQIKDLPDQTEVIRKLRTAGFTPRTIKDMILEAKELEKDIRETF
jgi:hypothetical protein